MSNAPQETALQSAVALIGRLLLAAIFLHDGIFKISNYAASAGYARAFGVPDQLMPLAIALELGGGLMIALGLFARETALLLAGFSLFTAVVFHSKLGDRNQLIHLEKNLAIAGGFLMLWLNGPGRFALGRLFARP